MPNRVTIIINGYDFGSGRYYGIHRNAMEITRAIDTILLGGDRGVDVEVVVPHITNTTPKYKNIKVVNLEKFNGSQEAKIIWREFVFPHYVTTRQGIGLDMTLGLPHRGKYCVFDYDCISEDNPASCYGSFVALRRCHYMNRMRKSLSEALVVFTDSEYAKKQILMHYDCVPNKLVVVPCAWQHMQRVRQDDGIVDLLDLDEGQYFFSLGSRYPYKNFRWVESAARQNPAYKFVVTGSEMYIPDAGGRARPDNVIFTGYLSDEKVKGLMAHCRAFLHPSLEEGFGIPPMEAMSTGARCVVSAAASLPEVYGDSVWYIDPTNYNHIDLNEIMSQPLRGTNKDVLYRYSWEKSAWILLETLKARCLS
jgi:glycosyltransferase involved in cell wall biosynthesis